MRSEVVARYCLRDMNKRRMMLIAGVVSCLLLVFAFVILTSPFFTPIDTSDIGPVRVDLDRDAIERTVNSYCELAKKEDKQGISKIITKTPPQYHEYRLLKIIEENGNKEVQTKTLNKAGPLATSPASNDDLDMLAYNSLTSLGMLSFRGLTVPAKEITGIWVNGDYARMRVIFELNYRENRLQSEDFFLVRENEQWKIFDRSFALKTETYPL